ncbi:transglutaminase family protein [Chroococcus sp. FPU101]|uniref:transglutaminase-like domain-containing protein n=1 Tax=Chroococcus sp. FPU101 TaxID=1974212 RepID=UPI001A8D6D77|nr:transglutaminase family protein [Chroococcus sp. FPU101]GFE69540.1 putative cysteine protease [Chroococcus sp. FPU101]
MLIKIGYDIVIESPAPVPMHLMLYTHPERVGDLRKPDQIRFDPDISIKEYIDPFGNRCGRIIAPLGQLRMWNDTIVEDSGLPDIINPQAIQHDIEDLPPQTLQYLLGSRYCEVDQLSEIAWQLFGNITPGWQKVQAICGWVHANIRYGYAYTNVSKTAYQVYTERTGVCRDFAHLALTFCRCLNIPARYAAGYLGDIRVEPLPFAMDFHAWFEVFLDGQWYTFDARHNVPRIGRVLMVRGRDAADVALMTSFGSYQLKEFKVWADEVPNTWEKVTKNSRFKPMAA